MVMLGLLVLIAMRSKEGKVVSMTDRIKVWRYFQGLTIEANNFAFEVKVTLSLESNLLKKLGHMAGQTDRKSQKLKLLPA